MMTARARIAFCVVVGTIATVATAADTTWAQADWTIDPAASSVHFHGSSTLHDFDGTAKLTSGSLHLAGAQSTGNVVADAASMDTAESGRDKTMHTDTMAVQTWPVIRFDLSAFTPNADGTGGTGTGTWTMHGVAQAIAIPVTIDPVTSTTGNSGAGRHLHAHLVIDIRKWGIKPPRTMLVITVDPMVTVDLDLALVMAQAVMIGSATAATPATSAAPAPATAASPAATGP